MKSIMSGQGISISERLRSSIQIYQAHKKGVFGNAVDTIRYHEKLLKAVEKYVDKPLKEVKILEAGCGQTAAHVALFTADGAQITGIDVEVATYGMTLSRWFEVLRQNGLDRAIKSFLRNLLFDRSFMRQMRAHYSKPVSYKKLDVRTMSAMATSFTDNEFDFVYSLRVFEHIENVVLAIKEIHRVLKPSGIAWIHIDLFPGLAGGHNLEWINPGEKISRVVPPWDHLFENKFKVNTFLNKLKLNDFKTQIETSFRILNIEYITEGKQFLTDEIMTALSKKGFSETDLLTRTAVFIVQKD